MNSRSINEISRTGTPAVSLVFNRYPPLILRKGEICEIVQQLAVG